MKKILFGSLVMSILLSSCGKDGDDTEAPVAENFLNTNSGSTWNYKTTDNTDPGSTPETYTLTSTNRDSTINGKSYHIYSNSSTGGSEYNNKTGNDYYRFQSLPDELGGQDVEELYLKSGAAVNASWVQEFAISGSGLPISFTIRNTNKIVEKGISKTVNGTVYNNVTRVQTSVSVLGLPPGTVTLSSDIQQYYAPNYGMIQADVKLTIDALGTVQNTDISTTLVSATLL